MIVPKAAVTAHIFGFFKLNIKIIASSHQTNSITGPPENISVMGAIFVPPIIPSSHPFFTVLKINVNEKKEITVNIVYNLKRGWDLKTSNPVLMPNNKPANKVI